jgi:arylamine N-acetyltransferase
MASPTFTPAQLEIYFNRIQLPEKYRPASNHPLDLTLLTALHIHHISTVPYENLIIHYSPHRKITLDAPTLFQKIVANSRGRGGYCMESTLLFLFVLRDLGFNVYPTGVRIRLRENGVPVGNFIGLVHIVLIVKLAGSGEKFVIDTAFGGDGPTKPLPLKHDFVTTNLGTQENRYIWSGIEQQPPRPDGERQMWWIYQYRNSIDKPWRSFYVFTEVEFLLADFNIMSHFTGATGETHQVFTVLIVLFQRSNEEDGEELRITGKRMLVNGVVKQNLGGRTEVVKVCETEEERIDVLKELFGITLEQEEKDAIVGRVTALKSRSDLPILEAE